MQDNHQDIHGEIVETPVQARQGYKDRPVLVILVASTALVVICFALVYLGFVKV
jgi:hypothetical protein